MREFRCDPDESAGLADEPPDDYGLSDPDNYYEHVIKPRRKREREAAENPPVLATYTLQVIGRSYGMAPGSFTRALGMAEILNETEENLSDLLPEGCYVRIREWDAGEESDG